MRSSALLAMAVWFVWSYGVALQAIAQRPPNVILIYADDLGWGDLGCYGHPTIRTPHLDQLALQGARFTQFYSAAEVCTPSRAALLTGRYPIRSGMAHDLFRVLRNASAGGLPKEERTIAEMLHDHGYATGCIGKWHLGHLARHLPLKHGFDTYFGLPYSNDMQPASNAPKGREKFFQENNAFWKSPLIRDETIIEEQPQQSLLTRRYTEEAQTFIQTHQSRPFFLYFPHTFPHVPLFASESFRGKSKAGIYGDVVEEIDWSVGQIIKTLRECKLEENTLVIFSSDNGPWLIFNDHGGSAGLLREGKGSTWEGGMRVPGIFYWPGKIQPGTRYEMACTMDIMPTLAALVGETPSEARPWDGVNIMPMLEKNVAVERQPFFYYRGTQLYAVRKGPWKAHFQTKTGYGNDPLIKHEPPQLYQIEVDASEKFNVAAQHPEVIDALKEEVERHRKTIVEVPNQLADLEP